jgi:hypothetical protein
MATDSKLQQELAAAYPAKVWQPMAFAVTKRCCALQQQDKLNAYSTSWLQAVKGGRNQLR